MEKHIVEREINLLDMFWDICLKWRLILSAAVLFAVVMGSLSYYTSVKKLEKSQSDIKVDTIENIELDEISKAKVNGYTEYYKLYLEQEKFNKSSKLMNLENNELYVGTISFYIDNKFLVEFPTIQKNNNINGILAEYKAALDSEEFKNGVLQETEGYINENDVYEIVDQLGSESYGNILVVNVCAVDKNSCMELLEKINNKIVSTIQVVTEEFGEHEIIKIGNQYSVIDDSKLLDYQKKNIDKLNGFIATLESIDAKLTDQERLYIDLLYNNEVAKEPESITPVVSKKMVVIGFIGGAAIIFFVAALIYLFNTKIRVEDDIEEIYGIKRLGIIEINDNNKKRLFSFIDRFIIRLRHSNMHSFTREDSIKMILASIRVMARKENRSKIYITGSEIKNEEAQILVEIAEELKNTGIEINIGTPILYNPEALEKLIETEMVMFIEKAGITLYRELADEIEICRQQDVKIVGAVILA